MTINFPLRLTIKNIIINLIWKFQNYVASQKSICLFLVKNIDIISFTLQIIQLINLIFGKNLKNFATHGLYFAVLIINAIRLLIVTLNALFLKETSLFVHLISSQDLIQIPSILFITFIFKNIFIFFYFVILIFFSNFF